MVSISRDFSFSWHVAVFGVIGLKPIFLVSSLVLGGLNSGFWWSGDVNLALRHSCESFRRSPAFRKREAKIKLHPERSTQAEKTPQFHVQIEIAKILEIAN